MFSRDDLTGLILAFFRETRAGRTEHAERERCGWVLAGTGWNGLPDISDSVPPPYG